jgi:hypothetical protein
MIPVYKNLYSHMGQGVVWNGPHGPVKGVIDYAVCRFGQQPPKVTFIVHPKGGCRPEEKTASMLYPNMKAWLKWKVSGLKGALSNLRKRTFNKQKTIESLLLEAMDLNYSSYGTSGFTASMQDLLTRLVDTVGGRGVTLPLCDTVRDEDLIAEMEAEIYKYTAWERRLEKKRKAQEKWKRKQEVSDGEV